MHFPARYFFLRPETRTTSSLDADYVFGQNIIVGDVAVSHKIRPYKIDSRADGLRPWVSARSRSGRHGGGGRRGGGGLLGLVLRLPSFSASQQRLADLL